MSIKYMRNTLINIFEIKKLFREYCKNNNAEFSNLKFENFLNFLETDFYDWVKENLRQFEKTDKS